MLSVPAVFCSRLHICQWILIVLCSICSISPHWARISLRSIWTLCQHRRWLHSLTTHWLCSTICTKRLPTIYFVPFNSPNCKRCCWQSFWWFYRSIWRWLASIGINTAALSPIDSYEQVSVVVMMIHHRPLSLFWHKIFNWFSFDFAGTLKEIEELKSSVAKLKLPREHTPRI